MNRPYSEAAVEVVAAVMDAWETRPRGPNHNPSRCLSCRGNALLVLDALAAAGLLLPEGAETRTEYGVETTFSDGPATLPVVNLWVAQRQVAFANRAYPQRVMERKTWSTGWVSVDAAGLAVGDSKPTQDPSVSVEETPHGL